MHASNAARFLASYKTIASELRLRGFNNRKTNPLDLVFRWLLSESSGRWLLILDSADDVDFARPDHREYRAARYDFTIAQYLPQRAGGAVLITSRDHNTAFALVCRSDHIIRIEPMNRHEARTLIDKKIPIPLGSDDERDRLASTLEYIPLAITQAAAYITRKQRMSIAKYLGFLGTEEDDGACLLKMEDSDLRRDPEVPNSVIRAWQISFAQIRAQNDLSADLLSSMSMFDRQGIPEFLLHEVNTDIDYEEAIETLLGYAVIVVQDDGASFTMHRLVQLAIRDWLRKNGDLERQREAALHMLARSYPTGNYENWAICQILEPHAQSVLWNDNLSDDAKRSRASVLRNRAWYNREQGNYIVAEEMAKQAMYDRFRILGAEDPDTLTSMNNLALTFWNQGRWNEAEELHMQVMETRKRVLGAEHPDTLASIANLALTFWNQGRWNEAEELEMQVMETRKRALGTEHPDTLASIANLASTFRNQGRWNEAEELHMQVMETRKRVLGAEHPSTLTSMNNLASTFRNQGRWNEAEELEMQVMEMRKRVLGAEHPDTLTSIANLASTFWNQGRWNEAEELQMQVMETRRRVLGAEHPSTLTSMNNLAWTMKFQGRDDEALGLMTTCLQLLTAKLGANHPYTKACTETLSSWRRK